MQDCNLKLCRLVYAWYQEFYKCSYRTSFQQAVMHIWPKLLMAAILRLSSKEIMYCSYRNKKSSTNEKILFTFCSFYYEAICRLIFNTHVFKNCLSFNIIICNCLNLFCPFYIISKKLIRSKLKLFKGTFPLFFHKKMNIQIYKHFAVQIVNIFKLCYCTACHRTALGISCGYRKTRYSNESKWAFSKRLT